MNALTIDLAALHHNIRTVDAWMTSHNASWTLVTKVLCGHAEVLRSLQHMGVRSMADSRLGNLQAIAELPGEVESWYLRLPHMPVISDVVRLADVSLNSETQVIEALSAEAVLQDRLHRIIIMIELGDLREGVLPGSLVGFYERIFKLPNLQVLGIGSNLGCLSGALPNIDQFSQLGLYHELLELKFGKKLPIVSAGTSAVLPLLRDGQLPAKINHFRIGESVFLGTDLVLGDTLLGLRDDAITLEAEVVEVKEKSLTPLGETNDMMPFESFEQEGIEPGQRGYRAVVTVGQLDTEVQGLTPLDESHSIVGASSDLTVVNLGENARGIRVGDTISFRPSYGALVRLMLSKYIDKAVTPTLEQFSAGLHASAEEGFVVPPTLDGIEEF
jgi:predicted amino acid racemase